MTYTDDTKQATAHTPEPWTYNHTAIVQDSQDTILADCEIIPPAGGTISPPAQEIANARRIVAAVNACEGISTEALEQGVLHEMLAKFKTLLVQIDEDVPTDITTRHFAEAYDDALAVYAKATGRAA